MRRLTSWFRRPRPTAGGPAAPIPELHPVPYSPAWHQRRAHRAGTAVHMAFGRWLVGHGCKSPEDIAAVAEHAAREWALFAQVLRAETVHVAVPDSPAGLEGGA